MVSNLSLGFWINFDRPPPSLTNPHPNVVPRPSGRCFHLFLDHFWLVFRYQTTVKSFIKHVFTMETPGVYHLWVCVWPKLGASEAADQQGSRKFVWQMSLGHGFHGVFFYGSRFSFVTTRSQLSDSCLAQRCLELRPQILQDQNKIYDCLALVPYGASL